MRQGSWECHCSKGTLVTQSGYGTFMNSKWDMNMSQGEEEARRNVGSGWEQNKHIKEELTDVRE